MTKKGGRPPDRFPPFRLDDGEPLDLWRDILEVRASGWAPSGSPMLSDFLARAIGSGDAVDRAELLEAATALDQGNLAGLFAALEIYAQHWTD